MQMWCGIDWAERHHDVVVINDLGRLVAKIRIATTRLKGRTVGVDVPDPVGRDGVQRVDDFMVDRWLLGRKCDSTWVWALTELPNGDTRLVTRVHAHYDWTKPALALLRVVLIELGRATLITIDGVVQAAPALHFSRTAPGRPTIPPVVGADVEAVFRDWGITT